jgi:hypothetical protein
VGRPRARRARDPRDREADVIATPAGAIAPPTAVSGEGTSSSVTQPTSAATGGTARRVLAAAVTSTAARAVRARHDRRDGSGVG